MKFIDVERYRVRGGGVMQSETGDDFGSFFIPGPTGALLRVIASSGDAEEDIHWEHVSVSCRNRCPNWTEMCFIKDLFFDPEEAVMQLHPPKSQYINNHPYVLHLWRPLREQIPMPPQITVGIPGVELGANASQQQVKNLLGRFLAH